jgi:hypothetical protein
MEYPKLSRPRGEGKDYTKLFRLMEVERKYSTNYVDYPSGNKGLHKITQTNRQ